VTALETFYETITIKDVPPIVDRKLLFKNI